MNIFGVGIFLSLIIHDSSQGLIGGLYWTAMKTDNLQANVLSYSSCMAKGGNFPQFDLNTREGRRLNMIRMNMDNLAKCTVLNIVVCGPMNHIKACYQLMLLLIQKPYLIAYLAASPFSCAMKLICQVWPTNPKMRCENGLPVPPPSISHVNMLPHLGLGNHFRPHKPDLIQNPNPCMPQQVSACGYPNGPSNIGPPLNSNMYPYGPSNYGSSGNNYQSLQPSPSFDSDPYNSNQKPTDGEGNKKNSLISNLIRPLRNWRTTEKTPGPFDSGFGLIGNNQPGQSGMIQAPGAAYSNPYDLGQSLTPTQKTPGLFYPELGPNGNNQQTQSNLFQKPGAAISNPYSSGPYNSRLGSNINDQHYSNTFNPQQSVGTGNSNPFNSGPYQSGYNPYDELNDDHHQKPSNLFPAPPSHSNAFNSNPYDSGFGQNKNNDHKKTPDPYDELLEMNVEDQQKFPSILSIVTHKQSTGPNQGNAGVNGNAQKSYPPLGSMSDPYNKQDSINSQGYPQGPYDMKFGSNGNGKQPSSSYRPGANSSIGNYGLNSSPSKKDLFDSGDPYETIKKPGATSSKFSMDSGEDYHHFGIEFGKEFNISMGIQI